MITIAVSHNIYLTYEERYSLHENKKIETTGISVPVWFYKGSTSEPGNEIFCKYLITCQKGERPIKHNQQGYEINITNSLNLLDLKDGGSEWLNFKQFNKVKKGKIFYNFIHFVEIKPIEILLRTIF